MKKSTSWPWIKLMFTYLGLFLSCDSQGASNQGQPEALDQRGRPSRTQSEIPSVKEFGLQKKDVPASVPTVPETNPRSESSISENSRSEAGATMSSGKTDRGVYEAWDTDLNNLLNQEKQRSVLLEQEKEERIFRSKLHKIWAQSDLLIRLKQAEVEDLRVNEDCYRAQASLNTLDQNLKFIEDEKVVMESTCQRFPQNTPQLREVCANSRQDIERRINSINEIRAQVQQIAGKCRNNDSSRMPNGQQDLSPADPPR